MAFRDRIIFALDVGDLPSARRWVQKLRTHVGWFKVGMELFTATGPDIISLVKEGGLKCFLDLKFHDIPNTVSGAIRSATRIGADMVTIHISGGRDMITAAMDAAIDEAKQTGTQRPNVVGVSVLTSLNGGDLREIGFERPPGEQTMHLAKLASTFGIDGLVCSAEDLRDLRKTVPEGFTLITPGIRTAWSLQGDQKRIATPKMAIDAGADFLVIGRPISQAPDPVEAVQRIVAEMETGQ
ncbi:MAG: orotidine-5'-phosphate decarboxylase [Desulfomonilia bacterium]|nr:orotidine-5'-phosphate decarboxylase [Desulfomonilia bacterium]